MNSYKDLSATNLAHYHHFHCDLFIHNVYNRYQAQSSIPSPSQVATAHFQRGNTWEQDLFKWLENRNLLLTIPGSLLTQESLRENVELDERDHFYVAGARFLPPKHDLDKRYRGARTKPIRFGVALPDLIEIRKVDGKIHWRVIDAKASTSIKTSHHVQIYYYSLCLKYLLNEPVFVHQGSAAIWLPPSEEKVISLADIKPIDTNLLAPSMDNFLFHKLPGIVYRRRENIDWHFNPLCRPCPYNTSCRDTVVKEGRVGNIPNVSLEDAQALRILLNITTPLISSQPDIPDIEDLHKLVSTPHALASVASRSPSLVKKVRRVLALPPKGQAIPSPVLEAIRSKDACVKTERSLSLPRSEDIAVILSLVQDPSSSSASSFSHFAISVYSQSLLVPNDIIHGTGESLVGALAKLIRTIMHASQSSAITTQFYVWSTGEISALQAHLVKSALKSSVDDEDIKICIGALAQGAGLLQTKFQPTLLSGVLYKFMSERSRSKVELVSCLKRLGLPTHGNLEELRGRVNSAIRSLQDNVGDANNRDRRIELGQLPRVAVLKREVERLIALPIPGYWDLPECAVILCPDSPKCPGEEEIFALTKDPDPEELQEALSDRNENIFATLTRVRQLVQGSKRNLLVNDGKALSSQFMDFCRQEHLRKLFFMQQFEVLTKLNELWQTRIDGSADAPVLEYIGSGYGAHGAYEHTFHLISGILDTPTPDKTLSMYDKILVPDELDDAKNNLPVEALFDDLAVANMVFPLNRWTTMKWNEQHAEVQDKLWVADVRRIMVDGDRTKVILHSWGRWGNQYTTGARYRISPRLVDFNTSKILASLFEMDLKCMPDPTSGPASAGSKIGTQHYNVPLIQLILAPKSFGKLPNASKYIETENQIQRLFRELRGLGNKTAESLLLKSSQHKAARRFLTNRLSVIWGPPGTGKTYTIALSLLRLLDVQSRCKERGRKIVFVTALTNAAIDAFKSKLKKLMTCYSSIEGLPTGWLSEVKVEHVTKGSDHPRPLESGTYIYVGTIYQLYNFSKKNESITVDCVVIDEAGQLGLGPVSLVLRSLGPNGRIVMAGDMEQLAPIVSARYPKLRGRPMFGSVLDCVVAKPNLIEGNTIEDDDLIEVMTQESQESIVQLTENFRLNPDLGEFVATIYSRPFTPQKRQIHHLATQLQSAQIRLPHPSPYLRLGSRSPTRQSALVTSMQEYLFSLSQAMLRKSQSLLRPPRPTFQITSNSSGLYREDSQIESQSQGQGDQLPPEEDPLSLPHPISLAMINMDARHFSSIHSPLGGSEAEMQDVQYEKHVRGEAALAAALVRTIKKCCPGEEIFVATPHRVQREAVKVALRTKGEVVELAASSSGTSSSSEAVDEIAEGLQGLKVKVGGKATKTSGRRSLGEAAKLPKLQDTVVTVDTIERLQGSEAAFVICLFTLPHTPSSPPDPTFLLERRRLNVAISRAKTLCILVTSKEVLQPRVGVLTDEGSAKGYKFLRAFEERAWRGDIKVDLDLI